MTPAYDVAVVGAGPSGLRVAAIVAEAGYRVCVIEEHPKIGEPVQCSGLVTPRVLEYLPHHRRDEVILSAKYGARVHGPNEELDFLAPDIRAYAIDRALFDTIMEEMARDAGADIIVGQRASGIKHGDGHSIVTGSSVIATATIVVGADGPSSTVARECGIHRGDIEIIAGWQAVVKKRNEETRMVDVHVGSSIAPGFFGWHIPLSENRSLVGLGAVPSMLKEPISSYGRRMLSIYGGTVLSIGGGAIPLGIIRQSVNDGCLLVGDAAAQVKPTSGGGLYPGLRCADIAGKTIIRALEDGDISILQDYHREWMATVGKELRTGMRLRKMFLSLSDDEIDDILRRLKDSGLVDTIIKFGDIDYPWKLAFTLARKAPWLLRYFPRLI